MATTRRSVTMQGRDTPVSAAGQGGKAGPQASSSCDRSSTLVGNLADVESNVTSEKITLPYSRTSKSKSRCLICHSSAKLVTIPSEAKLRIFINRGLIIQGQSVCCKRHLRDNFFKPEEESRVPMTCDTTTLTSTEVFNLLNDLREATKKGLLNFDSPGALNDTDYLRLTGITASNFRDLFEYIKGSIYNTQYRSARTCLAILLIKLRTGLSHSILSTLFQMPRRYIGKAISSASKALMEKFVPLHLGLDHISREEFIQKHTTVMAKALFANGEDVGIVVADGTYIYIQKSSNYMFQRRTFSVHKGRPLVKPMMFVSTTGYILDIYGPYFADGKNNDASILNSIIKQRTSSFLEWVMPEDILVVDRGFRDSIATLEEYGLIPRMPCFLEKGSQHDTISANESRLVTKIRWVVESVNGLIKRWKMLDQVIPNTQIPFIGDYVRIVSALCNAYRPPRVSAASPDDVTIAERMLALSKKTNSLQKMIEDNGWVKKQVIWEKIEATSLGDFPRLTIDDIHRLTIGVYQLKQAASYTREHIDDDDNYILYVHKDEQDILRVKLQSRHISSKQYQVWIKYERDSFDPIKGWYCQCKNGARVVGCCAHISSVLWYLGHYRHQEVSPHYNSDSYPDFLLDAADFEVSDEASGGEEEEEDEEEMQ